MGRGGFDTDVVVFGGCGHVGLPLGLAFASTGLATALYDTNFAAVDMVRSGKVPQLEPGAPELLRQVLDAGTLVATTEPSSIARAEHVVVVVGTPVDEHLNPDPRAVVKALQEVEDDLHDGQLLFFGARSFPGSPAWSSGM